MGELFIKPRTLASAKNRPLSDNTWYIFCMVQMI